MFRFLVYITLASSFVSTLVSADCPACDSYNDALRSCQTSSTAVGTSTDSTTIHCMCSSKSNVTDMNACQGCAETDPSLDLAPTVLAAWTTTCQADVQFGDKQAALCWQSQPSNYIPCVSKSDGSGGTGGSEGSSGSTNSGSGASTTSSGSTSR